jgi:16S rRNA (cytosine967-C5)-methyltransferase
MSKPANGADTRALAARAVDAVISHGTSLDKVFSGTDFEALTDRDQSLVRALVYGTVRTQLRNAALLKLLTEKPLKKKDSIIGALISVGLFALQDSPQPDYAVVSATVSATEKLRRPRLRGMVNAVLRRFLREQDELMQAISGQSAATTLLPDWLAEAFRTDWPDDWESLVTASNRQAPMWIRVNPNYQSAADWLAQLHAADMSGEAPAAELSNAVLLENAQAVARLPSFAEGGCSVQDIASQLAALWLHPAPGMRVLDACAAPGGKATHLLELEPGISELVAIDQSARRLERVQENLSRLGQVATLVTGDASLPDDWWDGQLFDRILIDAPCSATGVIRRHPDIRFLRRPADIQALAATQLSMLQKLWPLLKPGGRLLYSTCSVLRAENEAVVAEFLKVQSDAAECTLPPVAVELQKTFKSVAYGQQWLPGTVDNDGFYYALLERLPADS